MAVTLLTCNAKHQSVTIPATSQISTRSSSERDSRSSTVPSSKKKTLPENDNSSRHAREEGGANPNSGESLYATCQHLRAVKLVNWSNTSQLVKVSSQFWSKLQKGQIRGAELEIGQKLSC